MLNDNLHRLINEGYGELAVNCLSGCPARMCKHEVHA